MIVDSFAVKPSIDASWLFLDVVYLLEVRLFKKKVENDGNPEK